MYREIRSTDASPPLAGQYSTPAFRMILSLVFLGALSSMAFAADGAPPPYEWTGTVRVTTHGPKITGEGELTTSWVLDVRWRERERIPVRDANGRLAGEFVLLEDDGTTWSGSREGRLETRHSCTRTIHRYQGEGSGTRSIDTGWLYFSNVTDGELAPHLSDGAYYIFSGQTGAAISGTTTRTHHDTCRGGSEVEERQDSLLPLAFSMGREFFQPLPEMPELSAERLAATLEQAHQYASTEARFLDNERRRIENSRMRGSYRSTEDSSDRLAWEVEWDVTRRPLLQPSLDRVAPDWRPYGSPGNRFERIAARDAAPFPDYPAIKSPAGVVWDSERLPSAHRRSLVFRNLD